MSRVFIIVWFVSVCIGLEDSYFTKDACVWERLQARCPDHKVLLIEKASFGRLRSGRCFNLTGDEKPCYADVQLFVERHCSGRRECQIRLTNENLKLFPSNCSIYKAKSLEVEYKCIDVYTPASHLCAMNQSLLVTTRSGYLANAVTEETGQGSQLCPWRFEPRPGQSVYLTLLDFGVWVDRAERSRRNVCRGYATVKEKQEGITQPMEKTMVCGGVEPNRLIISADVELTVAIMKQENYINDTAYFFIKYQVFDCPKFDVPEGTRAEIYGDSIGIFCQFNLDLFWEVRCSSGEWTPRFNITCPTTLVSLSTAVPDRQVTDPTESCLEIFPANGASVERTGKGYRVSCLDGSSVELLCSDGTWVSREPSRCIDYVVNSGQDGTAERRSTLEACVWERLEARCTANKVLLIEKASFGRLRSGRCFDLTEDEKPCYADVQLFVERHCSGRRECQIRLTNENLKLFPSNCSIYEQKSLEIEYKCIVAYADSGQSCVSNHSLIVRTRSGYLANTVTDETGQGSQSCPWRFEPRPGQSIYLTLLDFGVWVDRADRDRRNICRIYATIQEMEAANPNVDRSTLVCGGAEREKFVMSTNAQITIALIAQDSTVKDTAYFFIKYQVFDCNKLDVPVGAMTVVSENGIRVYCQFNRDMVWDVSCVGGEWIPKNRHNFSCIDRTSLAPNPTDNKFPIHEVTGSTTSCPKLYSSDGVSLELTDSGYRASCSDGDSVELFCVDGTWVPSKPTKCIVFSTKTITDPACNQMKVAAIVLPVVALIALVVTVSFAYVICRRRRS